MTELAVEKAEGVEIRGRIKPGYDAILILARPEARHRRLDARDLPGCVPLNNLMEDAAAAEISRRQLRQWIHHDAYEQLLKKGLEWQD